MDSAAHTDTHIPSGPARRSMGDVERRGAAAPMAGGCLVEPQTEAPPLRQKSPWPTRQMQAPRTKLPAPTAVRPTMPAVRHSTLAHAMVAAPAPAVHHPMLTYA